MPGWTGGCEPPFAHGGIPLSYPRRQPVFTDSAMKKILRIFLPREAVVQQPAFNRLPWLVLLGVVMLSAARPASAHEFGPWPEGKSPEVIGHRVAENFLGRPHMLEGGKVIHYAESCTWYGALTFASLARDAALQDRLVRKFELLFREEHTLVPEPNHVDWTVFSIVPLKIYQLNRDMRCLALGEWMAQKQWGQPHGPRIPENWPNEVAQGHTWQTRLWIDDMFMITMAQGQAFKATGYRPYIERAAKEMVYYLDKLQKPTGLFHHAPSAPFYWARGNGWFAVGMAEMLRVLPADNPHRARIFASYQAMMAALLKHQSEGGMWHQLIDGPDSWFESSSTAMFTYAFITGVQQGWLDAATYGPAARKGWLAVTDYLDDQANLREVCEGTGLSAERETYLQRRRFTGDFHGQAPVLWCAAALLRVQPGD